MGTGMMLITISGKQIYTILASCIVISAALPGAKSLASKGVR